MNYGQAHATFDYEQAVQHLKILQMLQVTSVAVTLLLQTHARNV